MLTKSETIVLMTLIAAVFTGFYLWKTATEKHYGDGLPPDGPAPISISESGIDCIVTFTGADGMSAATLVANNALCKEPRFVAIPADGSAVIRVQP